jgi:hypothetical protein
VSYLFEVHKNYSGFIGRVFNSGLVNAGVFKFPNLSKVYYRWYLPQVASHLRVDQRQGQESQLRKGVA